MMMAPIYIHPRVKPSHLKINIHESSFKMCIYAMDYGLCICETLPTK